MAPRGTKASPTSLKLRRALSAAAAGASRAARRMAARDRARPSSIGPTLTYTHARAYADDQTRWADTCAARASRTYLPGRGWRARRHPRRRLLGLGLMRDVPQEVLAAALAAGGGLAAQEGGRPRQHKGGGDEREGDERHGGRAHAAAAAAAVLHGLSSTRLAVRAPCDELLPRSAIPGRTLADGVALLQRPPVHAAPSL